MTSSVGLRWPSRTCWDGDLIVHTKRLRSANKREGVQLRRDIRILDRVHTVCVLLVSP